MKKKTKFNLKVKPGKKLILKITCEGDLFVASCEKYSVCACHYTFEGMFEELTEQLKFLWDEFVTDESSPLGKSAKKLRRKLKDTFEGKKKGQEDE